jgi:hypothetical protein
LGVVGLALPLIPGIPFLIVGALLLGPDHRMVKPVTTWLKRRRFPGFRDEPATPPPTRIGRRPAKRRSSPPRKAQ